MPQNGLSRKGLVIVGAFLAVALLIAGMALYRGASDAVAIKQGIEENTEHIDKLQEKVNHINTLKDEIISLKQTVTELRKELKAVKQEIP